MTAALWRRGGQGLSGCTTSLSLGSPFLSASLGASQALCSVKVLGLIKWAESGLAQARWALLLSRLEVGRVLVTGVWM